MIENGSGLFEDGRREGLIVYGDDIFVEIFGRGGGEVI